MRLLGAFGVEREGDCAVFRTRKTASLLSYLTYYAGRRISKDLLVDLLWPDADADKGRQSLRMAVSALRSSLGRTDWDPARHLVSDRDTLSASEHGFVTDVMEFRKLVDSGDVSKMDAAVQLYSGPLLTGFAEDWILPQALELEETYAQAVCRLVEAAGADLQRAVSIGRKALAICPSREDVHVALIRAYGAAGQPAMALKQYEELERMLDEQWGEMPGDDARAALEALPKQGTVTLAVTLTERTTEKKAPDRAPFFGRERELAELTTLLQPSADMQRLVTLFGLGGTGKTRLSQQVAQSMQEAYDHRVWFVSLVGVEESAEIHETLLAAFVTNPPKNRDAVESIAEAVGAAPALLVFDNLEHVVPAARKVAGALLDACPGLRILATSRVPLQTPAERLVPLAPLPLPSDYRDLAALRSSPSVQLLVEAAQAVRPGFSVTPANAQSVLLLCRRLDGIPLAIELAAAKLATLSPAQLLASLARSADLSTSRESVPERHRSLQRVLEWTLALLGPDERRAFASLSVCRGGLNSELASQLLGPTADELLVRLCQCALLNWHEDADEVRFEMLETVREMAMQMLGEEHDLAREATQKHFRYVHRLCTAIHGLTTEAQRTRWAAALSHETGNILAALDAATAGWVEPELAWEMALPLQDYIRRRGRSQIWIGPLEALLSATGRSVAPSTAARAHALLSDAHYGLRAIRSTYQHCMKGIEAADASGDARLRIETRVEFTTPAITLGEFELAEKTLEAAIELLPQVDDPELAARCYLNLAWVVFDSGHEEDAQPLFRQAREYAERSQDTATIGSAITGLASAIGHTRHSEGYILFDRAVGLWTSAGMPGYLAHCLYNRAMIDYRHGKLDEAQANVSKSFRIYLENQIALGQSILTVAGNLMAALGRFEEAAACWGRAEEARQRNGMKMIPTMGRDFEHEISKVRAVMPAAELQAAFDRHRSSSDEDLVGLLFGDLGAHVQPNQVPV